MTEKEKINIIIVDDHSVVMDGVEQIISKTDNVSLIGKAADPDRAMVLLENNDIDLAIVDITLAGSISGIDLIKALRDRYPDVDILVMSMHDESIYGERAIRAGAKGYIMKEVASLHLVEAINTIINGDLYLSQKLQKRIVNRLFNSSSGATGDPVERLSDREFEIYQLIGRGFSAKDIASKLNLSTNTIETHRSHIKTKMKMKSSSDLVKYAVQWVIDHSR